MSIMKVYAHLRVAIAEGNIDYDFYITYFSRRENLVYEWPYEHYSIVTSVYFYNILI